jgi:hypothetical protein
MTNSIDFLYMKDVGHNFYKLPGFHGGLIIIFKFHSITMFVLFNVLKKKFCITHVGKRPLGRPQHRWEDNIRMHLRETSWKCVE